jgi:hypothetical protein
MIKLVARFQVIYVKIMIWLIGRLLEAASKVDKIIQYEISVLPDAFACSIGILPNGPEFIVQKQADGTFYCSRKNDAENYAVNDFGGGPRPWKFSWVINFQKCGTFFFLGFLMWYYQNFSVSAWIYLALQGSYGIIWFIKDVSFPDSSWQKRITIGGGINAFLAVLGWYWVFGWLLISGVSVPDYPLPDGAWYALCISMCMIGSVIMIAADAQKFFTLKYRSGLIDNGMLTRDNQGILGLF